MPTDHEPPYPQAEALAALCERAVAEALRLGEPDAFLAWMQAQAEAPEAAGLELAGEGRRRLLFWIGRSLWDCLPQPGHHFRPRPLPRPRRNDACPCGSGRKFKQCCARLVQAGLPPPEFLVERSLPRAMDATQRAALAGDARAPLALRLAVAGQAAEEGAHGQVAELLEPVFRCRPVRGALDLLLPALDQLVAALEALGREPACRRLMEHLAGEGAGPLAGYAHTRLAAEALVGGDGEEGLRQVRLALEADPADPRPATLEVSALVVLGRLEEAGQRAAHWRREAERHWPEETRLIRAMAACQADPSRAHPDRLHELSPETGA